MMTPQRKQKPTPSAGTSRDSRVTRQELEDVLADEGYSADRRKGRLKEVLTRLMREPDAASGDKAAMIKEVKAIIDEHQHGKPIAEDVLGKRRK